jgi:RimJ/RimL family protein N-acetyltransferase
MRPRWIYQTRQHSSSRPEPVVHSGPMILEVLPQTFAICRLDYHAAIPAWGTSGAVWSLTRTADELSLVVESKLVPPGVQANPDWRALQVKGPLDFSLVGVLATLTSLLALAEISIFAVSTFDTDYLLVKEADLEKSIDTLRRAGHRVLTAPVIRSDRLTLRPLSIQDLPFLVRLQSDPEVMKHISNGVVRTPEQVGTSVDRILALRKSQPRLGHWIVQESKSGKDIGTLLLRPPATKESTSGIEIGFSFLPETWGKGYATEAVRAAIEYSAKNLSGERVVALVSETNFASRRVLEKVGMKPLGTATYVNPMNGDLLETLLLGFDRIDE